MRRLALASCFVMACSTGGGPALDVPPAPRAIHYQPDTVNYLLVGHRRVEQEFQGQLNQQELAMRAWIRTELGTGGTDTLAVRVILDSILESGGGSTAGDLAAIRGATWTARLLASGEMLDVTGPSEAGLANQMANMVRTFYPRLPLDGVTDGAVWVDTVTATVDAGGVELNVHSINRHEAAGWQTWGMDEALLIRVTTQYTIAGEGNQSGQPLTLDGQGRRHVLEYLSRDGRFLGLVVADTSSYEVLLTALGMSIPGRQWRLDTLRVAR